MSLRPFIVLGALACALAAAAVVHVVRPGETLAGIAAKHRLPAAVLARANALPARGPVAAGQRLTIPRLHTVRRGDTLAKIAARHAVPLEALARANGIANPDRIVIGQRLIIPEALPVTIGAIAVSPARTVEGWQIVTGPVRVAVQAQGAARVDFYLAPTGTEQAPKLLGRDTDGADGWNLDWEPAAQSTWHLWAVAYDAHGSTNAASELLNIYRE